MSLMDEMAIWIANNTKNNTKHNTKRGKHNTKRQKYYTKPIFITLN